MFSSKFQIFILLLWIFCLITLGVVAEYVQRDIEIQRDSGR